LSNIPCTILLIHLFNGFFHDNLGKTASFLDFTGVRDDEVAVASAGPYANHLQCIQDR